MPAVVTWILGGLVMIAGELAGRVLLSLGFGWMVYAGVDVTLTWLKTQALSGLAGLPADMLGIIATMKVGEAISIVFSALLVRLTLAGLGPGGSIYKMVRK